MCGFCVGRKGGTEEGGWGHPQGAMHITADRLGYIEALVGTKWASSHSGCMNWLRKCYFHFLGGSILAGKAVGVLSGCLLAKIDCCMLVIEWAWL